MSTLAAEKLPVDPALDREMEVRRRASTLLGLKGNRRLSSLDEHDSVSRGLPASALHHLLDSLQIMPVAVALNDGLGISLRTVQRMREHPAHVLSAEQSGRLWTFAQVLSRAISLVGDQEAGELWLIQPAFALEGRRPIELLKSPAGVEVLATLMGQLEYGVYV